MFSLGFLYTLPLFALLFVHSLFVKASAFRHRIARRWASFVLWITGSRLEVIGREHIAPAKTYLLVANHQSSFDIFSLLSALDNQFRFISKPLYFKVPIIGYAMRHLGHIPIDVNNVREAATSIKRAAQTLKEGFSILIFPEGTRSLDGKVLPFKFGAIKIVELSGIDVEVVPVTIVGTINIQKKDRLALRRAKITIVIGKPILVTAQVAKQRKNQGVLMEQLEENIRETHEQHSDRRQSKDRRTSSESGQSNDRRNSTDRRTDV